MNIMSNRQGLAALLAALLCLGAVPAGAADKDAKDGKDQQLRGLQQRLRTAEQDKSRLAQEKTELDGQIKASADQLSLSRRGVAAAKRQRSDLATALESAVADKAALAAQLAALAQTLAESQAKLAESQAQLAESGAGLSRSAGQLKRSEASAHQIGETLAQRDRSLGECSAKNDQLYRVGGLLLGQFEQKGQGKPLEGEPLTLLARVAVENKAEELRDQLDQQRYGPPQPGRQSAAQRLAASKQADEEQGLRDRALLAQVERERSQRSKLKQQSDLDKLTVKLRSFFDNMEW